VLTGDLRTTGFLTRELDEWLKQNDTADCDPRVVYEGFKREVSHLRGWRRRGFVHSETTYEKSRVKAMGLDHNLYHKYMSKESRLRDGRVWRGELSEMMDASVDQQFTQSNVQPGGVTDFLYDAIATRYRRSCTSHVRHLDKIEKVVRPVLGTIRNRTKADGNGR
jgi:hypothetical protein